VLVMICSKSVPICNRFHTIRANSGKVTFLRGIPLFDALVRKKPPHPGAQNSKFCHKKLESLGQSTV